eukprot:SAG22_NODE_64_length_23238_cov_83.185566_3_plen_82_part_00
MQKTRVAIARGAARRRFERPRPIDAYSYVATRHAAVNSLHWQGPMVMSWTPALVLAQHAVSAVAKSSDVLWTFPAGPGASG